MAANLLPRGFRKRVARQKALDELAAERQIAQLRDQSMTNNTLSQIGAATGLAKDAYGLADKVVPMFGRKGDSSKETTLTDDFDSAIYEADRSKPGPARGRDVPTFDRVAGMAGEMVGGDISPDRDGSWNKELNKNIAGFGGVLGAPVAPEPPVAPELSRMGMAALERSGRSGQELDWQVPGYPMEGTMDTAMREAEGVGGHNFDMGGAARDRDADYDAAAARDRASMALAGGRPVMPAPLAGLRFPSQARYEDGMQGVHAKMAEAERDLFLERSGAGAERAGLKFGQQRSGPLRSSLGAQSAPEAVAGNTFSMPRGGGRPMPSPQAASQASDPVSAAARAQVELASFTPDRDELAGIMKSADDVRFSTFAQTAAAIMDAAQRGDRDRVKALQEASRHSRLSDVGPTTLLEMATGSHLDRARRDLLRYGEIDPMLESNKARAAGAAASSNASANFTDFKREKGEAMLSDDLRHGKAQADIAVSDAGVRPDLNRNKVLQAATETRLRPQLHRSTLATQAEGRADSRNRRGWRNKQKPLEIANRQAVNFEQATEQANSRGQVSNPYFITADGKVVRMTTDQERAYFDKYKSLPGLHELPSVSAAGGAVEPARPGAGTGRAIGSAVATATQRRADAEDQRKRGAAAQAQDAKLAAEGQRKTRSAERVEVVKRKVAESLEKIVDGEGISRPASAAAKRAQESQLGAAFNEMVTALMGEGVSRSEAEKYVTELFNRKRTQAE